MDISIGTERSLLDGSAAPCCPISWHSRRCPRARLSGSAETQSATQTQAQEETEFIRLLWLEIVQGGYDDTVIDQEFAKVGDAKGVFDAIHGSESAALSMQDKSSPVEGLALIAMVSQRGECHGCTEKNWTIELTSCCASFFIQSKVWRIVVSRLHKFQETQTAKERKAIKNFVMNV